MQTPPAKQPSTTEDTPLQFFPLFFCRNWLARKVTRHKRRLMTSAPNQRRVEGQGKGEEVGEHTRPDTSCCDETRTLPLFVLAICMCNSARFGHFSTFRLCRHDRHGGCCCYDCSFGSLSPDHQLTVHCNTSIKWPSRR